MRRAADEAYVSPAAWFPRSESDPCPQIDSLDQRGFARDSQCDGGAFEFNPVFADGFE